MPHCFKKLFSLLTAGLLSSAALAQETPLEVIPELNTPRLPLWEAGVFGVGMAQTAYPGADQRVNRVLLLPYVLYRGAYLRTDQGTISVRAIKNPRTEVDVGFAASLGSNSSAIEARRGMADIGTLVEMGPRLRINLGDIESGRSTSRILLPLRGVFDLNDRLHGRGIAFEPQWVREQRLTERWLITTNLGALFGDAKLGDTFYGVAQDEATPARPSYQARGGLIALRSGVMVSHPLTADVKLVTFVQLESVAGAANRDSPLVRRNSGWTAGVGLSWIFARSDRRAND
ncbi:MAG: MipA/OmpV family protein [Pseudomonadota bacterium]